ncbi:MAG: nuclease-related domain-containing protein [Pirellulaceae bacterium]
MAGHQAEIQMAFYLRRAFADVPDVHVFNDLRITRAGETAQMDHLVFHRYGFVIVESKSVTGTIEVNRHGEFSRRHGNQRSGMKSPIVQARMQGGILSKLLNDHCEELRRKVMFGMVQGEFGQERFHFLVAVSDQGVIERNGVDPPELVKADAVVDRIHEIMALNAEAGGAKGFAKLMFANRETEKRILKHRVLATPTKR